MEGVKNGKGRKQGKENSKPNVWFSLKKSLHCKSEPSEVHDPKPLSSSKNSKNHHHNHNHTHNSSSSNHMMNSILTRRVGRSGCSRSIANLKDVIHGSKRHIEKPPSCSPRSIGSSEFLNPITHEVILSNSKCELKITGYGGHFGNFSPAGGGGGGEVEREAEEESTFVGTLRPGTPGPGGHPTMHYFNNNSNSNNPTFAKSSARKSFSLERERSSVFGIGNNSGSNSSSSGINSRKRFSLEIDSNGSSSSSQLTCHKCKEQFNKWDALEAHHLSNHAVTELVESDSSRKIVEIICRTSWLKSENHCGRIERVLKVHNTQKTIAKFEEYRELVKIKASKLPKKHPRCLADGNELLRFYGTTVACSLGIDGSSSLCASGKCCVCRIIRHGFYTKKEIKNGVGVFTTSTSGRAFQSIEYLDNDNDDPSIKKALVVCRVIAGRVHRPLENVQELAGQTGFDSLAEKVGLYSSIEELYLLNPRALLPCFVVICKP
ncbi:Protein chiffon [Bienertia sinuspersici]